MSGLVVEAAVQLRHRRHEHAERATGGDEIERRPHLCGVVEDVLEHVDVDDRIELLWACGDQLLRGQLQRE